MSTMCAVLDRVREKRELSRDGDRGWVSVVTPTPRKRGDVEREDAQRFALLVQEWTNDWNSERDRSYKLP